LKVTRTDFEGLLIIEPRVFEDNRGYFFESYNKKKFLEEGIEVEFVQDNQSFSKRGVIRGLHYQIPPHAQIKMVRVLSGVIQDVVVDLRKNQPTFGKHFSIELSAENNRQVLVPAGFAHGFLVLSESADVLYKCNEFYYPKMERGIYINDPALKINWQLDPGKFIFSEKDTQYPILANADNLF
jgi:dTDP-4-dehydrorhamnose 3,5-epimerase